MKIERQIRKEKKSECDEDNGKVPAYFNGHDWDNTRSIITNSMLFPTA